MEEKLVLLCGNEWKTAEHQIIAANVLYHEIN
jgi:hypothetical protein